MRALALAATAALAFSALAQDKPPPKPAKKAARTQLAHKKPTPEQLRKFNELEKKKK